jgi:hypothetical protein
MLWSALSSSKMIGLYLTGMGATATTWSFIVRTNEGKRTIVFLENRDCISYE